MRGGFSQTLLQALGLLCLNRGGFTKPGHLILQSVAALLQGFIRTYNAGQRVLGDLQSLSLLRQ